MNTTTMTQVQHDTNLRDDLMMQPAEKVRKPWRVLRAALATFAVSLGLLMVPAAPAQAATAVGTRDVCFKVQTTVGWLAYDRAVRIDVWLNGQANVTNTIVTPGANGCLRQNLPAGYWWRFRVYHYEGGTTYTGQSAWTWVDAGSYAHLGTVYLASFR